MHWGLLDQVLSSLDGKPIILGFEMTIRWDSFLTILFFVPLGAFGPALLVQLGPKTQGWRGPVRSGGGPVRPSLRAPWMDQHPGETEKKWQGLDRPKHLRS